MGKFFHFIKSTVFLVLLCTTLAISTLGLTVKVTQLGLQVANLTANAAAASIAYKKDKAQAVAKIKAHERAKARIKRFAIAGAAIIPAVGLFAAPAMAVSFEKAAFDDWKTDNLDKDFSDYACETGDITAEVIDETLQELPESLRLDANIVSSWMPECGVNFENQSWISDDKKWMPSLNGITGWIP